MALRIEDYALIGDTHTAALVGAHGSIDWLCLPRFDSGACFASLLGTEDNGFWQIAPADEGAESTRRYRGPSLVLETEFRTAHGDVRVIDCMPPRRQHPWIVRVVEGVRGSVPMRTRFKPRFDYGKTVPWVIREGKVLHATAGPDAVQLQSDVELRGHDMEHSADFTVSEGQRLGFVLCWYPSEQKPPPKIDAATAAGDTEEWWREWAGRSTYDGAYADVVERSLITLKALTYEPTGGIVAAPTTSLPEFLGGVRNWDYRYCWIRDAALTLDALMEAGYVAEAESWRDWILRAVAGDPEDLQIMYGLSGERRLEEFELDWLPGYEGSAPVRVGNAASGQLQLDVYGELSDALYRARELGMPPATHAWAVQAKILDWLEAHWRDPDDGLWEVRGPRRHFVHSKVMAWVAVDRMVRSIEEHQLEGPLDRLRKMRDEIHQEVCDKGYDADRNTFTQYYGSKQLDAALLVIPQVGFLPPSDPRVVGTVDAVQQELLQDGFVMRYIPDKDAADGLPPGEGAFLACSFWLVNDLAMIGRAKEAEELFERLLALRNDLGLFSEEYDPVHKRLIGNFPQAFTHLALISSAKALSGAHFASRGGRRAPVSADGDDSAPPTGHQHEIRYGEQIAVVGEVGATLRRYAAGGVDVLDGFEAGERSTAGRGQVLAPWPNRLDGGRYEFDGVEGKAALDEPELDNAIHGLVRWQTWRAVSEGEEYVRMGCVLHPQPAYPWRLELEIEYRLGEEGLRVTPRATNESATACPFGIGFHPYLTVAEPLVDTAMLSVPAKGRLVCDERGLPKGHETVDGTPFDFIEPRRIGDKRLDTAFTDLAADPEGRARAELRSESGRGIALWAGPEFPYLMVYTGDTLAPESRRRRGIAVEPMTCPPNALRTGTDVIRLEPGGSWTGEWGITPWPA